MPLRPDAQNLFAATPAAPVTHVRLNIFPDGGVARFRVYGRVAADWVERRRSIAETRAHVHRPAASISRRVENGGLALACSDAFFGPMNNLLLPGPRREHGRRLGDAAQARARPRLDPDPARRARHARARSRSTPTTSRATSPTAARSRASTRRGARITDLIASAAWVPLLPEVKLAADDRRFFATELVAHARVSHVRLNIFPDGGVSRLRAVGHARAGAARASSTRCRSTRRAPRCCAAAARRAGPAGC